MTKVLEQLSTEAQAEAMSVLDWYEKRGIERGIERGKATALLTACRNMIQEGFNNEVIGKVLEVDVSYVEQIRTEIAKEH